MGLPIAKIMFLSEDALSSEAKKFIAGLHEFEDKSCSDKIYSIETLNNKLKDMQSDEAKEVISLLIKIKSLEVDYFCINNPF